MKWRFVLILLFIPNLIESGEFKQEFNPLTKVYESDNIVIYHHINTSKAQERQVMKKGLYKLLY